MPADWELSEKSIKSQSGRFLSKKLIIRIKNKRLAELGMKVAKERVNNTLMPKNLTLIIRQCRLLKGWTQAETARRLGVSQSTFNSWESGKKIPTFEQMLDLYRLFGSEEVIDAVICEWGAEKSRMLARLLPSAEIQRLSKRAIGQLQSMLEGEMAGQNGTNKAN